MYLWSNRRTAIFQFQYGSIKSLVLSLPSLISPLFNSNMVRLKDVQKQTIFNGKHRRFYMFSVKKSSLKLSMSNNTFSLDFRQPTYLSDFQHVKDLHRLYNPYLALHFLRTTTQIKLYVCLSIVSISQKIINFSSLLPYHFFIKPLLLSR